MKISFLHSGMKKYTKAYKKNLRTSLTYIIMIYMDGLNEKKKARLARYLDPTIEAMVEYYVGLVKKKDRKSLRLPELHSEITAKLNEKLDE